MKTYKQALLAGSLALATSMAANAAVVVFDLDAKNSTNSNSATPAPGSFTYTFAKGSYKVEMIDGFAWSAYPDDAITPDQWKNEFRFTLDGNTAGATIVKGDDNPYATMQEAFDDRETGYFTLGSSTDVTFFLQDQPPTDNRGMVRLSVSAVPEASTLLMMLGGIGMVGFMAMRRKQADALAS